MTIQETVALPRPRRAGPPYERAVSAVSPPGMVADRAFDDVRVRRRVDAPTTSADDEERHDAHVTADVRPA